MTDRQITRIWIFLLLLLVLAIAFWGIGQATAAPLQAPYVDRVDHGMIVVYYPYVTGYDSGYMLVRNTCTGEQQAVYLTWQGDHPLDAGEYRSNPIQLVLMGECTYLITDGWIGVQSVYIPSSTEIFYFQVWRAWMGMVVR